MSHLRPVVSLLIVLLAVPVPAFADRDAFARALSTPGHAVLIRHANAPGTGDPAALDLDDCSTQRNLDDAGRAQAARLGRTLRSLGVTRRPVYSSRWCRCRDTASLLDIGPVETLDGLNSFYGDRFERQEVMPRLHAFLEDDRLDPPPILVTHQVNITALTGVYPREGEMVAIAVEGGGRVRVVARLRP